MLRDLKALLLEANQKVPPFLQQMDALSDDLIDLGGQSAIYQLMTDCKLYIASSAVPGFLPLRSHALLLNLMLHSLLIFC